MALFRGKPSMDILETKRARLSGYVAELDQAVSLVTHTIDSLDRINGDILETVQEIEDYQKELEATREGLVSAREKNQQVILNFRKLLCVD